MVLVTDSRCRLLVTTIRNLSALILLLVSQRMFPQGRITANDVQCPTGRISTSVGLADSIITLKILLVQFIDVTCAKGAGGSSPRYSVKDFEDLIGSEGVYVSPAMYSPDGDAVFGSVNDYFLNMSGGKLRIRASVINRTDSLGKPVWVTLGQTKQFYQDYNYAIFDDATNAAYRVGLDPSLADDSRLVIIYAGNAYFLRGGLNPEAYGLMYLMSEVQGRPYNQELPGAKFSRIGIHCHEFAHTIGVGHTTGGRADVMYGGTSNGSAGVEGNVPAPLNAIARVQLGWADAVSVETLPDGVVDIPYSLTHPTIYVMKNSSGDYFYIENRRFDRTMMIGTTPVPDYNNVASFPPAGPHHMITEGIFVWRVNTSGDKLDPGYSSEGLVYASGRYGRTYPENVQSDTDDGVPFPGVSNNRLLNPWSDPRNPYMREVDYFGGSSLHYTLFVPNTKGGSNCGMEILSEKRGLGVFRVRFYTTNPPNPALAGQPYPDSVGAYEARRTIVSGDSGAIHQVMEVGGELFYRRSAPGGFGWTSPVRLSQGNGGNHCPCMTQSGPALLVAWQMDGFDAVDSGRGVYLTRSTDGGNHWSAYFNVGWSYRSPDPGAYPTLAGAKDGSAMLVYRTELSSLVSEDSRDAGASWSEASPVPVGSIAWNSSSLVIGSAPAGGVIAYAAAPRQICYDTFKFGSGSWGKPREISGVVPAQYSVFSNPNLVSGNVGASPAISVAWDAADGASGGGSVIISRRMDAQHPGSSYRVLRGAVQDDLSFNQLPISLVGETCKTYSRALNLSDSSSGELLTIEIGRMWVVRRGENADSVWFSDFPPDSVSLDIHGLIDAGRSTPFTLFSNFDTLHVLAAIYGHDAGALIGDGRVGFEIIREGSDSPLAEFGVESAGSLGDGSRRLALLSFPASSLPGVKRGYPIAVRPFFRALRTDSRMIATIGHIYSNLDETPVIRNVSVVTGIASSSPMPQTFALGQNYPNPFNPATTIRYSLPSQSRVSLEVFDVVGRTVAMLVNAEEPAGQHAVAFDASRLASGTYFYCLRAGGSVAVKKMLLVK